MTTQKTSALIGPALDWAVAVCNGYSREQATDILYCDSNALSYSTDWKQGGPIIEREGINLGTQRDEPGFRWHPDALWHAQLDIRVYISYGPTPLVAAMRCYVASKLGDIVDIPDNLV